MIFNKIRRRKIIFCSILIPFIVFVGVFASCSEPEIPNSSNHIPRNIPEKTPLKDNKETLLKSINKWLESSKCELETPELHVELVCGTKTIDHTIEKFTAPNVKINDEDVIIVFKSQLKEQAKLTDLDAT